MLTVAEPEAHAPPPRTDQRDERRRARIVLTILVAFQLMVATDLTVANIALPGIQASLGFSAVNLAWVINAYTLTFGGLLLLGGRIGDLYGRRRMFVVGTALFTVASVLAGAAPTAAWLLSARVGQGVGSAIAAANALALISSNFDDESARNRAISVYAAAGGLGATIGLILGGVLVDVASWRWTLWINVPVGVVLTLVSTRHLRDGARHGGRLDVAGALSSTLAATALVYGFIRASQDGWRDPATLTAFGVAATGLAWFLVAERRTPSPLAPRRLFTAGDRNLAYAIMMLLVATVMGSVFFLTQYLQQLVGYGPLRTGAAFLPLTLAFLALAAPVARLVERIGAARVVLGGAVVVLVGIAWISRISPGAGYLAAMFGPLALMGGGMAASVAPLTVVAMQGIDERDTATGSGLLQVTQQFGISIGLAVLVTAYGTAEARATGGTAAAMLDGTRAALTAGVAFVAAAITLAIALRRITARLLAPA